MLLYFVKSRFLSKLTSNGREQRDCGEDGGHGVGRDNCELPGKAWATVTGYDKPVGLPGARCAACRPQSGAQIALYSIIMWLLCCLAGTALRVLFNGASGGIEAE
jgi:hypothetical protein